jgi:chromosomal replication initiation ATPase DnaA
MTRQMAFDLPAVDAFARGDFFVSPTNALALATVDGWRDWPGGKLVLIGPAGAGKTHLAHVWAAETGATLVQGTDLSGADLPALAAAGAVVVEDAHGVAGDRSAEVALFHLHNLITPMGRLLLTAPGPVRDWGLGLPDLKSRVEAAQIARLGAPDDALLSAVLVKLFADRQVVVAPALIAWMVPRMERSIAAARAAVSGLDAYALALGRPITRALAAAHLHSLDTD